MRLCVMATIGKSIQVLYAGRLEFLLAMGFDITVVCASSELDDAIRTRGVRLVTFPLTRAITPWTDLQSLVHLTRFFRAEQFDIVEISTPKAALLGSIAARLAGSRCVIHMLQGLAYEGKAGTEGWLVRTSTRLPCRLAHLTLSMSPSMQEEVLRAGFCNADRIRVLGTGTVNGIDVSRFVKRGSHEGVHIREKYQIPQDATVIGFVGRMVRDKGIEELFHAFVQIYKAHPRAILLVVGEYEERDRPSEATIQGISAHPAIRHVGWQNDVVPFLAAMDIFVLPTYREGFGMVLLEAAATGLPTVTTNATGARDAILDGITGLRVPVRDARALQDAIEKLMADPVLRDRFGSAGREWVIKNFNQHEVWQRQVDLYKQLCERSDDSVGENLGC